MPSMPTTPVFVDGLASSRILRTGMSRQFHRKSRTGCERCRARRVKCNEAKPSCRDCERHKTRCVYDRAGPASELAQEVQAPTAFGTVGSGDGDIDEPEESTERRMSELELLHFYITETGPSIPFDQGASHDLYVKAIPRMAFKSKALLYSLLAAAALHWTRRKDDDGQGPPSLSNGIDVESQHQLYIRLAIRFHRDELSQVSPDNADILFMTASLMRLTANAILSERDLQPYAPPVEWLRISKSHYQMYHIGWNMRGKDGASHISKLVRSTPATWGPYEPEGAEARHELDYIIQPRSPDTDDETLDEDTIEVYSSTVGYICGVLESVKKKEQLGVVARHIILFPVLVEERFIDFVEEARPRALVVLAHYFALLVLLRRFWYVGETGRREVGALAGFLPPAWQDSLKWPLQVVKEGLPDYPA